MESIECLEDAVLARVALDTGQARLVVAGLIHPPQDIARLFSVLAEAGIKVDLVVQNETGEVSASLPKDRLEEAVELLDRALVGWGGARISRHEPIAILSVMGTGLKSHGGVAATLFEALATAGINIEMISTSEMAITVVLAHAEADRAFDAVCRTFEFLDDESEGSPVPPSTE